MDEKIIKIPISYENRKKNEKGKGYVPCQVSERYLNFSMESTTVNDEEFIYVDVTPETSSQGIDKLLTRSIIKKGHLLQTLKNISPEKTD